MGDRRPFPTRLICMGERLLDSLGCLSVYERRLRVCVWCVCACAPSQCFGKK